MPRALIVAIVSALLATGLAACGKRATPEHPPGSTFPRQFPADRSR